MKVLLKINMNKMLHNKNLGRTRSYSVDYNTIDLTESYNFNPMSRKNNFLNSLIPSYLSICITEI